jgi:soluble lytic murein transglycosylase
MGLAIPRPNVDEAASALIEWRDLPGARSTKFSNPDLLSQALERIPDPRVTLVETILANRAGHLSVGERKQVAHELVRSEKEQGLDAILLLAMIEQESRYDPRARGPRGSLGLMQVRPFVGEEVAERSGIPWKGPETLHNPALNVRIGVGYFAELKRMYPDNTIALAAYNMGPYRVKRILASGKIPMPRYVFCVLERYHALRAQ